MQKITTVLNEIKLVGITTRTNNAQIFDQDPSTNKIAALVQEYFRHNLAETVKNRTNPGTTFCVYTEYENDEHGDYTYFIGEEVSSFEEVGEGFAKLTIPAQKYEKFTNTPGPMPIVCIDMWKAIWKMTPAELGGKRAYGTDFEVYDERSKDHNNVTLDLYISVH